MHSKQKLLLRITCFFWIVTKVAGYQAWLANGRLYPVVPPFKFLDVVPAIVHSILFWTSLSGLALLIIFPLKRFLLISTLVVIVLSCTLDVLRWQPWEYQYLFFLLIFIINHNNPKALYSAIVFVLASVYIYSGLHKINGGFLHTVWDSMMLHRFMGLSRVTITHLKLHHIGLALPVIEAAAGLALLFTKKKFIPAVTLMGMHIFIIILLSGIGLNYNSIVLPWNFAMLLILYFFYYKEPYQFSLASIPMGKNAIVFLAWGILPALSFTGRWDNMLSSSLYSGNGWQMDICIKNPEDAKPLKEYFAKNDRKHICNGEARLPINKWSTNETGVQPYHEYWYYKRFKTEFEKKYPNIDATFIVYRYPYKEREILE